MIVRVVESHGSHNFRLVFLRETPDFFLDVSNRALTILGELRKYSNVLQDARIRGNDFFRRMPGVEVAEQPADSFQAGRV